MNHQLLRSEPIVIKALNEFSAATAFQKTTEFGQFLKRVDALEQAIMDVVQHLGSTADPKTSEAFSVVMDYLDLLEKQLAKHPGLSIQGPIDIFTAGTITIDSSLADRAPSAEETHLLN